MEGKKNNFIRKYIFSEELSLDARLVNITCLTGGLGIFLAMMFRIVISISEFYGIIVVLAVALAVIILIMFIANFFHAYTTTKIITIVLMCLIMLPTAFFFVGGIGTSIECYFVLALFIILQLTRGWLCAFFATLHVILVSLCHYIQYIHPELIEKLSGSADSLKKIKYIDTIQGYLISSLIIGIIVSVQSYFYRMEKAKNESVTHDLRIAQQTTSAMFEGNPHINILFDDKFNIVDCNPIALNYLGFADKDELRQKFVQQMIQAIPAFQSNGKRSISLVERLNTAVKEGAVHFETELFLLGQKRILDVNLIRIPYGDNFAIVGYLVDLTAARATERELIQQDKLLAAVNGAATMLFSDVDFETALTKSIEQLAAGANLDSISVWNIFEVNGKKECNKIIEWFTDAKTEKMSLDPRDDQFNQIIMQWEAKVRQGENFNGPLYTFSEDVQEKLKPMGVTSLLVIPIYIQKNFWGFMSFNDHHEERTFSDNEVNILRSGSLLVSGAVIRNQMTQKISDTANRLNTVLSNYAGIIWSVDKEGIITTFNGQYLEKIGVAPNFLVGKNIDLARAKNIHGDILENVKIALQDEKEQNWIGEVNGRQFQHHLSPLYSAEGNFIGVMGSTDDITESVILQNELKAAMEEAQAASRAKGEFLSNMSHEIRTPMNAIIGMTSIGKGSGDIERKNYAFGKIEDASSHLLGIINDILDMSKIEAGKFELSFVEFSFEKMLRRVSDVITFKMDEKKQKFMVRIDKNIPSLLMGDDMRLAQVITNLLSNAVKFTPEGGVINMNAVYMGEEDNNVTLRVEVRDSGIGISPDQQARLFKSFQQAESGTTRKFGGTGLGLAISKQIVEMMGGEIWIDSEIGKGACFSFTIKAQRVQGDQNQALPASIINMNKVHALAVDDMADVRDYFLDIAHRLNFNCDVAESGEEALSLIIKNGDYDIYFIDWKMPNMNGLELAREIKKRGNEKSIITMISSAEWSNVSEEARAAGIKWFLPKPLFPSAISDCINEYLGLTRLFKDTGETFTVDDYYKNRRILLVEDVEINKEIVLALLEPTALNIDWAVDGKVAFDMYRKAPNAYEMILMDIQMPGMDGYQSTRLIREFEQEKALVEGREPRRIPIIAMTANVFREDVEKCFLAGMDDHIGKPLILREVIEKLRKFLK